MKRVIGEGKELSIEVPDRGKQPELSIEERDRRWRAIRNAMRKRNLECLIIWGDSRHWDAKMADVRYVTQANGFTEETICIFPLEGEPSLITWTDTHDFEWFFTQSWVTDIRGRKKPELVEYSRLVIDRIKELGLQRGRLGVVGLAGWEPEGYIPYLTYDKMMKGLPEATFENATDILEKARLIKSPEEVKFIEKATEIGDLAAETLYEKAKPGVNESKLVASMFYTMITNGAELPIMFLFNSGAPPHAERPSRLTYTRERILKRGDLICTEYSPRYCGYYSHLQRPCTVGTPRKVYEELFNAGLEACNAGLRAVRPGITAGDLSRIMGAPIKEAGFSLCAPYMHGIGLGWEPPMLFPVEAYTQESTWWGRSMGVMSKEAQAFELKAGMILAFELGPMTKDGRIGLTIGDPVLVTETGARRLSKSQIELVTT